MTSTSKSGLIISAPASGSGKTVITLALLRALRNAGYDVAGAKAGPDYIDPQFHMIASGMPAFNFDPWAMGSDRLFHNFLLHASDSVLVEGMMGLFDGAADGSGSVAELAKTLGLPVVLIVDVAKQAHSVAAVVKGFCEYDRRVDLCGVILNRVGSPRHEAMLREALSGIGVNVLGAIPRDERLVLPERHLGLVQAGEIDGIEDFMDAAATLVAESVDLESLAEQLVPIAKTDGRIVMLPPLGQRIAVAKDEALAFGYVHVLADWQSQGAEISFFSPLSDEEPSPQADAVFLPGGYPELHAAKLASASKFKTGLIAARERSALIYGECGGYMVLGEGLVDASGERHAMTGLLRLETSFKKRKLNLGYRQISAKNFVLGDALRGHEFHYTSAIREDGEPLFEVTDALGDRRSKAGLREGNVMGSYMHVIDRVGT